MFTWTYLDGAGLEAGSSPAFPDRDAAEGWLVRSWEQLAERGIEEVSLVDGDGDGELYRMSLRPE